MSENTNLICKYQFNAQKLATDFPPVFRHPYKTIVHDLACPPGSTHAGEIVFSRWNAFPLPQVLSPGQLHTKIEVREDFFGYEPGAEPSVSEWYLNFADENLFGYYSGALFAQDEMQVAEHPALASLRSALLESEIPLMTVEHRKPTPVLIKGVERRCRVATEPNPTQLRPFGLYGNNFARADVRAIQLATTPINPPTLTNLIAMAAPSYGEGIYTEKQITYILTTAFTGFAAARLESGADGQTSTVIHTGFWGCGAFGGNRLLMTLLQSLAANLAEVERLVFHAGDAAGSRTAAQAIEILEQDFLGLTDIKSIIEKARSMKFRWGEGDGN